MEKFVLKNIPILTEPTYRYHTMPNGEMVDVYDVKYELKSGY